MTIPYSKEEKGIVERANKEVNRHIRNILADDECIPDWPQMLCMTEKLLNSTVKHALGVSPNTLLFGDAIPTEQSLLAEIDQIPTATPPRTIRDYVDKLMDRLSRLIVAVQKSQQKVNADNLEKRYSTYPRRTINCGWYSGSWTVTRMRRGSRLKSLSTWELFTIIAQQMG